MNLAAIVEAIFKLVNWLWQKHEAKEKTEREPLTNAEENADIDNLPHS